MMGKPSHLHGESSAFASPAADFWREHLFNTGEAGETEVLWVAYPESPRYGRRPQNALAHAAGDRAPDGRYHSARPAKHAVGVSRSRDAARISCSGRLGHLHEATVRLRRNKHAL